MLWQRIILVLLCSGAVSFCTGKNKAQDGKGGREGGNGGRNKGPLAVVTANVEQKEVAKSLTVQAVVEGIQQVDVYAKVAGRLASMQGKIGERVNKGELLFRVNRSEPGETYLETPVFSPIEGWIGRWSIDTVGTQINTQDPVVTIIDDARLKAKVFVPEEVWLVLQPRQKVHISFAGVEQDGQIIRMARALDPELGRGEVQVEWDNDERNWRAGLLVSFQFTYEVRQRILIPAQALSITDDGAFVFQYENGKVKRKEVSFSVFDFDRIEITKGLAGGEEIVTSGLQQLSDGSDVKLASAAKGEAKNEPN